MRSWFGGIVGESDKKTTNSLFTLFLIAIGFITLVLILTCIVIFVSCSFPPATKSTCSYGEIGDLFGGILNPILTFLAFMGLLITIAVQKDELSQTRKQLASTALSQEEIATLHKNELINTEIYRLLESLRETGRGVTLYKKQESSSFQTQRYTESGTRATMQILNSCLPQPQPKTPTGSELSKEKAKISEKEYDYISSHMSSYFEQLKFILYWIEQNSDKKIFHRELVVSNMNYQEVYIAYIFAHHIHQEEFLTALNNANLIDYVPNHNTFFDKLFR